MAASLIGVLDEGVREKVSSSRILVVGAGGIGCELLKNLVLTGFVNIETVSGVVNKCLSRIFVTFFVPP